MAEYKLEDWFPMSPLIGPPLPKFLSIYWPWYKEEPPPPPPVEPPSEYGDITFDLINPAPAPRWGLNVMAIVGSTGYSSSPYMKKVPIGETISYNWDDMLAWASKYSGYSLRLDFSLRDEQGQFIGRFYCIYGNPITKGHHSYIFDYATKQLIDTSPNI